MQNQQPKIKMKNIVYRTLTVLRRVGLGTRKLSFKFAKWIPGQKTVLWLCQHSFADNQQQNQCLYLCLLEHMKILQRLFHVPVTKWNYFLSTKYREESESNRQVWWPSQNQKPESHLAKSSAKWCRTSVRKDQKTTWKPSTVLISTILSDSTPKVSRNFWRKSLTWCLYGDIIANRELDLSSGYLETSLWYIASTNSTSSTFCQEPLPDGWDSFPSWMSKKQKGPKQRYSCQERFVCSSTSGPSSRASS